MSSHKNSAVFAAAVFQLRVLCCRLFIAASRASLSDAAPGRSLLSGGAHHRSLFLSSLASSLASSLLSDAALRQQPAELRRARCSLLRGGALCCNLFRGSFTSSLVVCSNSHSWQPPVQRRRALLHFPFSSAARSLSLRCGSLGRGMLGGGSLRRSLLLNGLASSLSRFRSFLGKRCSLRRGSGG